MHVYRQRICIGNIYNKPYRYSSPYPTTSLLLLYPSSSNPIAIPPHSPLHPSSSSILPPPSLSLFLPITHYSPTPPPLTPDWITYECMRNTKDTTRCMPR